MEKIIVLMIALILALLVNIFKGLIVAWLLVKAFDIMAAINLSEYFNLIWFGATLYFSFLANAGVRTNG